MSISRGVWKGHVIKLANKTEKIKIMETISLKTSSLSAEGFFSGDIFEGDSRKVDAPKTQKIGGSLEIEQIEGRRWKTGCTRGVIVVSGEAGMGVGGCRQGQRDSSCLTETKLFEMG